MRAILLTVLAAAACGTPSGYGTTSDCVSSTSRDCTCADLSAGTQFCSASGKWGTCGSCAGPVTKCKDDGMLSSSAADCCSEELDSFGKCCTGDACCNARNHSESNASACECETGYVESSGFSASNRVCLAAPDLHPSTWSLEYWLPGTYDSSFWICLNQKPDGTSYPNGDTVQIANIGTADAGNYGVALGIQNLSSGQFWYGSPVLVAPSGTRAGSTTEWTGPLCISFSTATLPSGTYTLAVEADIDRVVGESDGTNNLSAGTGTFYIN